MKKILVSLLAGVSAVCLYSCSDDFKVAAPYKNITLVYGLLNMEDTAHYIKIQKAFLDENKNAIEMAKVPDSNYYPDLNVVIKEIVSGNVVKTINLQRVDVNREGYQKDTGTFFTAPNYAYKFKEALNPNSKYRLVISNPDAGFTDSSEIQVLDASELKAYTVTINTQFNFSRTVPTGTARLDIPLQVPSNARYIEGKIKFRWVDKDLNTGQQTDHDADFIFAGEGISQTNITITNSNVSFYSFLKSSIPVAPDNIVRQMDSCDLHLAIGAQEMYDYIIVTNIQSGGLTADQLKPLYTNILGDDVYGIFSSRAYRTYKNIPLTDATLDSFRVNPITRDLNIRGRSDH